MEEGGLEVDPARRDADSFFVFFRFRCLFGLFSGRFLQFVLRFCRFWEVLGALCSCFFLIFYGFVVKRWNLRFCTLLQCFGSISRLWDLTNLQKTEKCSRGFIFWGCTKVRAESVFLIIIESFGKSFVRSGATQNGGINFQVFFWCLAPSLDHFGTTFGFILG